MVEKNREVYMYFRFFGLILILFSFLGCKTESESRSGGKSIQFGDYVLVWEEIDCKGKVPDGMSFVVVENGIEDRFCRFTFDGPEYIEFSLDPKQRKEFLAKAGSYNLVFFTSAYRSDFREKQLFSFPEGECYKYTVYLRKDYRDYEYSPKR